jgi:hypothetical protein
MSVYRPDVAARLDLHEVTDNVNYHAPALTASTLASSLYGGDLWCIRERVGKPIAPFTAQSHRPSRSTPEEDLRIEFKPLEMTCYLLDYHSYFLLWFALIFDEGLQGRATEQTNLRYGPDRVVWPRRRERKRACA